MNREHHISGASFEAALRSTCNCADPLPRKSGQRGYALLMVLFVVATMILFATMATPTILNQGRREQEEEIVWRGNQYVRAIRLYYQKNGRFPQSMDDLKMTGIGDIHFLRKVYRDPVNTSDGSWRFIYVSPSGQLTGSVHYHSLQEMAAMLGYSQTGLVGLGTAPNGTQAGQTGTGTAQSGQSSQGQAGVGAQSTGAGQGGFGQSASGQSAFGQGTSQPQPVPLQAVDGPVFGASIIGVASKVKQHSLRVYQKGTTYFEWEFIWNPLMNTNGAGQPGQIPGLQLPGAPGAGTQPAGAQSGAQQPGTPGQSNGAQTPQQPNTNLNQIFP